MKPDTDASVCCSPVVCSTCATPYSTPSTTPTRSWWRVSARVWRRNSTNITTAAMPNRTARKSAGGTCSTRSWIRKKVDPHTAVTLTSRSVASRACRSGPVRAVTASSDDRQGDGAALGHLAATGGVLQAHRAEEPAEGPPDGDLEPLGLQGAASLLQLLADDVGHGDQHRALGHDELDGVTPERGAVARALADHLALGDGVAVLLLGGIDLQPQAAQLARGSGGVLAGEVGHVDRLAPPAHRQRHRCALLQARRRPRLGRDHLALGHLLVVGLGDLADLEVDLADPLAGLRERHADDRWHGIPLRALGDHERHVGPTAHVAPRTGVGRDDDPLGNLLAERLGDRRVERGVAHG